MATVARQEHPTEGALHVMNYTREVRRLMTRRSGSALEFSIRDRAANRLEFAENAAFGWHSSRTLHAGAVELPGTVEGASYVPAFDPTGIDDALQATEEMLDGFVAREQEIAPDSA